MPRPAIFLDRDGTLIEDREYLRDPAGVRLFPGVAEALRSLRNAGFALVVVTNQSAIGRGWMSEEEYQAVNAEFLRQLEDAGISIDAVYHCPAAPAAVGCDEHPDRKPRPGMYLRAAKDLDLDLSRSWAIGDSRRDVVAGQAAGCMGGILVRTGKAVDVADEWTVDDLRAAAAKILLELRL